MKLKMNKKAFIQELLNPYFLIILVLIVGFIYLNSEGKISFLQDQYFQNIDMPKNVSRNEDINIEFQIINDGKTIIKPELEIIYDNNKWRTYNRYVRSNEKIELDQLYPDQITTYSIEFDSRSYDTGGESYNFTFNLYEGNELLDVEVKNVYIKE